MMAPPRFAFRASKFRNIDCKSAPREGSYDQLQVTGAAVDGNPLAVTRDRLAFAHQIDSGAAIQVKELIDTGKETAAIPPLLRGHHARVNALEFSPFEPSVLFSASADATVKVWRLPPALSDLSSAHATLSASRASSLSSLKHHPSAAGVLAAVSHRETIVFDVAAEAAAYEAALEPSVDDAFSSVAWNWEGSVLLASTQAQRVRLVDPRAPVVNEFAAHSGRRRPSSVAWCGHRDRFLTTGWDAAHERELKLWDPRSLAAPLHRERLDGGIGQLLPLVDADVGLLYVLGRGDRSVRVLELDDGGVHALSHALLPHSTLGAALERKQRCDTRACEVARVLSLSATGGVCDVLSVTVPRRDAGFQRDLYPPTLAGEAALTSDAWLRGEDAAPVLEPVAPTVETAAAQRSSVFGSGPAAAAPPLSGSNGWGSAASPWASAAAAPAAWGSPAPSSAASSGWASKSAAWNAPPPPPPPAASSASRPVQWFTPEAAPSPPPPSPTTAPDTQDQADSSTKRSPDKAASRFASSAGHKLKYIKGTLAPRLDALVLEDHAAAAPGAVLRANASFLALPVVGAGGPVLVAPLSATGKASSSSSSSSTRVLRGGHKAPVADVAFAPFTHALATGSSDATIALWSLDDDQQGVAPLAVLRGHRLGVRSLAFHPVAADVLCSTAADRSVRLWDVATQQPRAVLADSLEDAVWNAAFSPDGALLATSSRARLVRVLDPRAASPLVALGCGFDAKRPQYVAWLARDRLLTVGPASDGGHEVRLWDARRLEDPLCVAPVAAAADAELVPLVDASTHALFLPALGSRTVHSMEVTEAALHANLPFTLADDAAAVVAAALLPAQLCDVRALELARLLVLRSGGRRVDRLAFHVPRHESLTRFFQDDLFGDLPRPSQAAPLSAAQWFDGADAALEMASRCPPGLTPLSQRVVAEADKAVPMSQVYRQRWEQEAREQREKEASLARLQALAAQPSLHAAHQRLQGAAADSDDDWDE